MKILWIGPFLSDVALREKSSASQAAATWSRGLLKGLARAGCEIRVIANCAEQRWPKGRVFLQGGAAKWFLDWYPCERIGYLNVVGLKDWWLNWAYRRAMRRVLDKWRPDVVLLYNTVHANHVAAMCVAKAKGVPCVPIILDGDDPRRDDWGWVKHTTQCADGVVFLSWWMKEHFPIAKPTLHMDGGADSFKGTPPQPSNLPNVQTSKTFTLVHTGTLDQWCGLNFMRDVIAACQRRDVKFIFCGKYDREMLRQAFGDNARVDIRGLVSETELEEICRSADVFLNVREPTIGDNILNYPSKVPGYLAWGRPVVSTWVDSFSPDYRQVLEVCDNTPTGFVRVLGDVLAWNDEQKKVKFNQIKTWFEDHKDWGMQAKRLIEFCEGVVGR